MTHAGNAPLVRAVPERTPEGTQADAGATLLETADRCEACLRPSLRCAYCGEHPYACECGPADREWEVVPLEPVQTVPAHWPDDPGDGEYRCWACQPDEGDERDDDREN